MWLNCRIIDTYTATNDRVVVEFFNNLVAICSIRLSVRTLAFHAGKRGSIPLSSTICLVLSGYRVQTCTLCGPNWRGTGPNITA